MTDPLAWCADLVDYACRGRSIRFGSRYQTAGGVWVDMRNIRIAATRRTDERVDYPERFGAEMMRRTARAGLIAARDFANTYEDEAYRRPHWRFTTLALAEEWDAEHALSEGERAERTASAVRSLYERNHVRYGDKVALWPVSTNLAAVPQDGIGYALEGGLLREHRWHGDQRLVPAEEWDAFSDALAAAEDRAARIAERHHDLVTRLHDRIGGDARNLAHLADDQLVAILDRLPSKTIAAG